MSCGSPAGRSGRIPTIVELGDADAPIHGRAVVDDLELVHEDDLEDRRGALSPATMRV